MKTVAGVMPLRSASSSRWSPSIATRPSLRRVFPEKAALSCFTRAFVRLEIAAVETPILNILSRHRRRRAARPDEPERELVSQVAARLHAGQVVALPTDTFYGLAVDPVNLRAVDRIYELKSRARHKPLSLLVHDVAQAYELARGLDTAFDRLAERFWPGPLTLIVKAGSKLPLRVTANTGNVALRVPEAAIPRAVVAPMEYVNSWGTRFH